MDKGDSSPPLANARADKLISLIGIICGFPLRSGVMAKQRIILQTQAIAKFVMSLLSQESEESLPDLLVAKSNSSRIKP